MNRIGDWLRVGRSNTVPGYRYGILIYGISSYYFLTGVYSLLSSTGAIHDNPTVQGSAVLQFIPQGAIAVLNFVGAFCLFFGRFFEIRLLALFGAAIVPAFRVYLYAISPAIDPLIPINVSFSLLWVFLLIFFSVITHREITLLEIGRTISGAPIRR